MSSISEIFTGLYCRKSLDGSIYIFASLKPDCILNEIDDVGTVLNTLFSFLVSFRA